MQFLSQFLNDLFDHLARHEGLIRALSQYVAFFSFSFALWRWWAYRSEHFRRNKRAERLAQRADELLQEEEAAPAQKRRRPNRNAELIVTFQGMLENEGRRNFWWGLLQNAIWFALGLIAPPLLSRLFA